MQSNYKGIKQVQKVTLMRLEDLQIHPLAETTPVMVGEQYQSLLLDLEVNELIHPILLFRNRIIDGRHRFKAYKELARETIATISVPHKTSIEELKTIVLSSETGRKQTPSQLAIYAYKLYKDGTYKTIAEAGRFVGISSKQVSRVKGIVEKHNRPDIIEIIFNGGKITTSNGHVKTDSVATILNWLGDVVASSAGGVTGLVYNEEPSAEEEIMISQILSIYSKQSAVVRDAILDRMQHLGME